MPSVRSAPKAHRPPATRSSRGLWVGLAAWFGTLCLALSSACTPHIGDACTISTDCSTQGTRLCDTSQYLGYCTVFNCTAEDAGNACPDNAVCVEFNPQIPGCPYSDRDPSAMGQNFCMKHCDKTSDCRAGYICADPTKSPWNAVEIDNIQGQWVCIVASDAPNFVGDGGYPPNWATDYDASVCWANWPDAGFNFPDATSDDAGADAATDAAADGSGDGSSDAGDASIDATVPSDGGTDSGSGDGASDSTAPDAGIDAAADAGTDAALDASNDSGGSDAGGADAAGSD